MKHVFTGFTNIGAVRSINQDALFMKSTGEVGLFCVADGMGGHQDGEKASRTIVKCLGKWWDSFSPMDYDNDFQRMMASIGQSVENANRIIRKETSTGQICGSTVVILFIYKDLYGIITAGDSRIYLRHKKKLSQLTIDETWENQSNNKLSMRAKLINSNYGKLVNAIGIADEVRLCTKTDSLMNDDLFLLCCDGIYKYCSAKALKKVLKKGNKNNIGECAALLRDDVFANGAKDNMTLILVNTIG